MFHLYHETPACGACGSKKTGRIIRGEFDDIRTIQSAARRGEYIMTGMTDEYNCFCFDCGTKWKGTIRLRLISDARLREIKKEKGLGDEAEKTIYSDYRNDRKKNRAVERLTSLLYGIA